VPTAIQFKQDLKLLSVFQYLDMPFNNNTNYEYDEGAPLTGFLNYIRMNQDKKIIMIMKQKDDITVRLE
jgi:hypothetical protein